MRHSPAPWKLSACNCGDEICNKYTAGPVIIALDKPDAQLISAAPEMLELLKYIRDTSIKGEVLHAQCLLMIDKAEGK